MSRFRRALRALAGRDRPVRELRSAPNPSLIARLFGAKEPSAYHNSLAIHMSTARDGGHWDDPPNLLASGCKPFVRGRMPR